MMELFEKGLVMYRQEPIPKTADLRKYIDTTYYGDRPHIRGRRLLVSMIAANAKLADMTVSSLAYEFSISETEVLAALLYYHEHQSEIDQQDREEQNAFDAQYHSSSKSNL